MMASKTGNCDCVDDDSCKLGYTLYKTRCRKCDHNTLDVAPLCVDRERFECPQCGARDSHTRIIPNDIPSSFASAIPYPTPEDDLQ